MKRSLIQKISWLAHCARIDDLIHRMTRGGGGCILAYHHISATALETQLDHLSNWYSIVSLDEFVQRHRQGRSTSGLMVITFDDGFAQEIETGAALALRRAWPMTFYLPVHYIRTGHPYWFIELASLMQAAPQGAYEVRGFSFRLGDDVSREQAKRRVVQYVFGRADADIEMVLQDFREAFFQSGEIPPQIEGPKPISARRVGILARQEAVAFEAHSVNHPFFCRLTPEEIRQEMETSRREVEEMAGRPVRHFCYPYGSLRSIGEQAPDVARSLFRSATTAVRARCRPGTDTALLPRITMHDHYTPGMTSLKVKATR